MFIQEINTDILQENLNNSIFSVSGWRKLYGQDEDSMQTSLNLQDYYLILTIADSISNFFINNLNKEKYVLLGRDSRPTGRFISILIKEYLKLKNIKVLDLDILPVTETLSYVVSNNNIDLFIYISASHNPPGYNGFKIGLGDGKVLDIETSSKMVTYIKKHYTDISYLDKISDEFYNHYLKNILNNINTYDNFTDEIDLIYKNNKTDIKEYKLTSEEKYKQLIKIIISNKKQNYEDIINEYKQIFKKYKPKVAIDYNGSSRINSIDYEILKEFNIEPVEFNKQTGVFVHRIVPEGDSLIYLKNLIVEYNNNNNDKINFGYIPDCDGDRGNIVININNEIIIPDAQTTFFLSVVSEILFIKLYFSDLLDKTAVIVNGPTSLRIENFAKIFGVKVFYSEVGERNVINQANNKIKEGYFVRIIGEGSNGGNITLPGTVSDPLSSIFSVLKLSYLIKEKIPDKDLNLIKISRDNFIKNLLDYSSQYYITSSFEKEAIYKIKNKSVKEFKQLYEKYFIPEFNRQIDNFKQYGISEFEILNIEGTNILKGIGNRTGNHDGGFKILLKDENKDIKGFLWMRPSKTEPVFRVVTEYINNKKGYNYLYSFHKKILDIANE